MTRIATALACLCLSAAPLAAQSLSPGLEAARILPGWTTSDGSRIAAIEFRLEPGWKTYWRSPGDSGLPPAFDWTGSDNLGDVVFHWPAPEAIPSGDGMALGYHDRLVLPFTATPADPTQPIDLAVAVDFGVCDDICVPAHVALESAAAGTAPDPAIAAALEAVPQAQEGGPRCVVEPIEDGMRVTATLPRPVTVAAMELPGRDVWTTATDIQTQGGQTTLVADFVPPESAPFALDQQELLFTLIDDRQAVEIRGCG